MRILRSGPANTRGKKNSSMIHDGFTNNRSLMTWGLCRVEKTVRLLDIPEIVVARKYAESVHPEQDSSYLSKASLWACDITVIELMASGTHKGARSLAE